MSRSICLEKKRWMLALVLGFAVVALPLGVFARGPTGTVWVADEGGNSLTVIDAATNKVVKTITGIMGPHNVQVAPDGKTVWATSGHENEAVVIDAKDYKERGCVRALDNSSHRLRPPRYRGWSPIRFFRPVRPEHCAAP